MKRTLSILFILFAVTLAIYAQSASAQQKPETLTKQQLKTLIATANTPAEHRRIAQYFDAKSQEDILASHEHQQMLDKYYQNRMFSSSKFTSPRIDHCRYLANSLRESSLKMQKLAQVHEQMASEAEHE